MRQAFQTCVAVLLCCGGCWLGRGRDANPLAHVLQAIGEPLECKQYNTWNVIVPEGQFLTRIGNDNFYEVCRAAQSSSCITPHWQPVSEAASKGGPHVAD
jgi:hypothetical protein